MVPESAQEIQRQRDEFFRRTRKTTVGLYVVLGLGAFGAGAYAVANDIGRGALGIVAGILLTLILLLVGELAPMSARTTRITILALLPVSAVAVLLWGDSIDLVSPFVSGACAGLMAGTVLGVAAIRRRLSSDDDLFVRQKRLGFDPERPYAWIRGGGQDPEDR